MMWVMGLTRGAPLWLTWLDAVAGLAAFVAAGAADRSRAPSGSGLVALIAIGLFALFLAGVVLHAPHWQVWSNLALACAFGLLAGSTLGARPLSTGRSSRPTSAI
jgi:hypothetical protein